MILQGLLLNDPFRPPAPGWLRIEADRITDVQEGALPEKPDHGDERSIICPGFIDAHLHLPQIDSIGCDGMDLLDWLDRVIFPAEIRWQDEEFCAAQVCIAYRRLLNAGTLGYAAFLTSHFHGYVHTVRAGHGLPLRAVVGQALMDRHAPAELLGHPLTRLAASERSRVQCSVNPRFAVSCSEGLLKIAAEKASGGGGATIQTHLAESKRECALIRQLFPNDPDYTSVYDRFGLLTERTLLAHCLHLSKPEWELIAKRQAVVVHCPGANTFLKAGVFDLNSASEHGVRLALGSDIAAGPDLAMPRVARAMIEVAKLRAMTIDPTARIPTPAEAWHMITRGNADALGWSDAGRLEMGAAADVLVLNPPFDIDEHLLGRLIYTWRDDYIAHRVVAGVNRRVASIVERHIDEKGSCV